jgi:predicted nuclease of predicted toxin-antitoxin system
MKVLLDSCVWDGAQKSLKAAGHDARWTGDLTKDPGDTAILNIAYQEKRVLVTLDKDFGELAIVYDKPHYGIIRLVGHAARRQGPICVEVLQKYEDELEKAAIITVEQSRVRIRSGES